MKKLSEEELDNLKLDDLVNQMDERLASSYWGHQGDEIMKLRVRPLTLTQHFQSFDTDFQRKVAYKVFGLLLQLKYSNLAMTAQFVPLPEKDTKSAKQVRWAAREQWIIVSSRIAFEYFMQLIYMLGTGTDFGSPKSAFKKFRKWLKRPGNNYTYFAISGARAYKYDRALRTPEVHGGTKLARKVLLSTAASTNSIHFSLDIIIRNQWQFVLAIADDKLPNGWAASGDVTDDREWYEMWKEANQEDINRQIDSMFGDPPK